jgi:transposase
LLSPVKKTVYDPKRHRAETLDEKLSYISQLEGVRPEDRVYLDEMGATLNMNLEYGRSRRGERVYDENPTAPGETINTVAVFTERGVEAVEMHRESLTAQRFIFYLSTYLIPLLMNGKVLIMDNHPVHHAKRVVKFLEDENIQYIYLPAYSPELNPIEEAFSKAKHYIKGHKPRELGDLAGTIERAIKTITPDDVIGYVNHAEEFLCVTG